MLEKSVLRQIGDRELALICRVTSVDTEYLTLPEPHLRLRWHCRDEAGEPFVFVQALSIGYAQGLALGLREALELAGHWDPGAAPTTLPRA